MFTKGDFHIHSTASDGNCTPSQIVSMAKKRNVDILSITDHNTTNGICEAIIEGKRLGVTVIPGIELSTRYENIHVHVLGYFRYENYNNELLTKVLKDVKSHKLSEIKHLFNNVIDFYGCKNKLTVQAGIGLLKFFGAAVVLAHPVLIPREKFKDIVSLGFDGIEAKYFSNTEKDTEYFLNAANNLNMFYTAGSDFHKTTDMLRAHGMIGDTYLSSEEIDVFLKRAELYY